MASSKLGHCEKICYGTSHSREKASPWEGQNSHGSPGQLPRSETGSIESYSADESRKRILTEDDMRTSGPTQSPGQEEQERLASLKQPDRVPRGSRLWQSLGRRRGRVPNAAAGLQTREEITSRVKFEGIVSENRSECGTEGNWSRDCSGGRVANSSTERVGGQATPNVQEKLCPCGAGVCSVLTANTVRNRGRNFYRCPLWKVSFHVLFPQGMIPLRPYFAPSNSSE